MASSSSPPSEEQRLEPPQPSSPPPATVKECVYKTKLVEFLGRTTPIVLQNDNGPCPLLAICKFLFFLCFILAIARVSVIRSLLVVFVALFGSGGTGVGRRSRSLEASRVFRFPVWRPRKWRCGSIRRCNELFGVWIE